MIFRLYLSCTIIEVSLQMDIELIVWKSISLWLSSFAERARLNKSSWYNYSHSGTFLSRGSYGPREIIGLKNSWPVSLSCNSFYLILILFSSFYASISYFSEWSRLIKASLVSSVAFFVFVELRKGLNGHYSRLRLTVILRTFSLFFEACANILS